MEKINDGFDADLFGADDMADSPIGSVEFKIQILKECAAAPVCDTPAKVNAYIASNVLNSVRHCADKESFVVLFLDARRRITGFEVIAQGLLDSVLVHPREVFFPAIATKSHAIIVAHSHPGGNPEPSAADIRTTRDLIRAGQLLKIEILDHIIFTENGSFCSMKEIGHFYA